MPQWETLEPSPLPHGDPAANGGHHWFALRAMATCPQRMVVTKHLQLPAFRHMAAEKDSWWETLERGPQMPGARQAQGGHHSRNNKCRCWAPQVLRRTTASLTTAATIRRCRAHTGPTISRRRSRRSGIAGEMRNGTCRPPAWPAQRRGARIFRPPAHRWYLLQLRIFLTTIQSTVATSTIAQIEGWLS